MTKAGPTQRSATAGDIVGVNQLERELGGRGRTATGAPPSVAAGPKRDLVEDFRPQRILEPITGTMLIHAGNDGDPLDRPPGLVDDKATYCDAARSAIVTRRGVVFFSFSKPQPLRCGTKPSLRTSKASCGASG